jgi:hypothetical protein
MGLLSPVELERQVNLICHSSVVGAYEVLDKFIEYQATLYPSKIQRERTRIAMEQLKLIFQEREYLLGIQEQYLNLADHINNNIAT